MSATVNLRWNNPNNLPTICRVYKDIKSMDVNNMPNPIADNIIDNTYIDTDVEYETEYFYIVSAYNELLGELFSNEVSLIPNNFKYLYSSSWDQTIKRIDMTTGDIVWSISDSQRILSTATDNTGNVYYGGQSDTLYKVSSNGSVLWSIPLTNSVRGIDVNLNNEVYAIDASGYIIHVDQNGNLLNELSTALRPVDTDSLKVISDGYYILNNNDIILYDFNHNMIFSKPYIYTTFESGMDVDKYGNVYVENNGITKYDKAGNIVWSVLSGSFTNFFVDTNDYLYATTRTQGIYKLDLNGNVIWNAPTSGNVFDCAVDGDGNVYYGDRALNRLIKLDQNMNVVWSKSVHSNEIMYSISVG